MSLRKTTIVIAWAALVAPAAFANSGATWVGGEAGFETHPVQSSRTRAQVLADLEAFRADPTTADGGRFVGGEVGYVPHQHRYASQAGQRVHDDAFAPRAQRTMGASAAVSEAEQRAMREQYVN